MIVGKAQFASVNSTTTHFHMATIQAVPFDTAQS